MKILTIDIQLVLVFLYRVTQNLLQSINLWACITDLEKNNSTSKNSKSDLTQPLGFEENISNYFYYCCCQVES